MVRECLAGAIAAAGFVLLITLAAMPWWLAISLGAATYVGLRFTLPGPRSLDDIVHDGGITEAERRAFMQKSQRPLSTIHALSQRLAVIQPDFAPKVRQLCHTAERLLSQFERQPKTVQLAGMFPLYLEKIAENLERYVRLAPQGRHHSDWQQGLRVSEEMVQSAIVVFERLAQRLSADDWIALEAEAETLKTLLESDLP